MIQLIHPKEFQSVSNLPFCYLCGKVFLKEDIRNRDHIPSRKVFHTNDRNPPLILKTHEKCNHSYSVEDKKIGQLIGRIYGKNPTIRDQALNFEKHFGGLESLTNLNIESAVWRWIRGFHAALYRIPLIDAGGKLELPLQVADINSDGLSFPKIVEQHPLFVEIIKRNRLLQNLDRITSNNNKLIYECVWILDEDHSNRWFCVFALNLYDWKKLGARVANLPEKGCVGIYYMPDFSIPETATKDRSSKILIPNYDILDPFAA